MDTNLRESASSAGFRALVSWKLGSVQSAAVWCSLVQFSAVWCSFCGSATAADCSRPQLGRARAEERWIDVPVEAAWTGPVDRSGDGLPFFGRLGEGVVYGAGYSGRGVAQSWDPRKVFLCQI